MISMDIVSRIVEIAIAEDWTILRSHDDTLAAWLAPQSGLLPFQQYLKMDLGYEWVEHHPRGLVTDFLRQLHEEGAMELMPCGIDENKSMIAMHVSSSEVEKVFQALHEHYHRAGDACHFIGVRGAVDIIRAPR